MLFRCFASSNFGAARLSNPILVPDGRELITLREAADYIMDLPKETFDLPDWQVAMEALALVSGSEQAPRRRE